MKCLKRILGEGVIRMIGRCRNKPSQLKRADRSTLRKFGHMERMNEGELTMKIYRAEVDGVRKSGRERRRWMDKVGEFLEQRDFSFEECEIAGKGAGHR